MKFHQLARHQFAAQQQTRDLSPSKLHQLQATNLHNNNNKQTAVNSNALSDEEDDDFNDTQAYYDSISEVTAANHLHQLPMNAAGQQVSNADQSGGVAVAAAAAAAAAQLDSSGFLMDKNKKLFPQKLWELIHNPNIQHCLRWSQDGQRVYLNRNEFEAYYLKTPNNQFHTQKAISFVRQMNMYGFRKVDDCYYENDNFRRDRQHLLRNMIRRHPNKGLFVGLDHHQLAAAAAAQQAIQVNQQLQHLENQHKHRTEQALRLNSYLNNHHHHHNQHNHHRFHEQSPTLHQQHLSAVHHQSNHHLQNHSSPFEHMSSQLAAAAASHLSQHQHLGQHQQHPQSGNAGLALTNGNSALPLGSHLQSSNNNNNQVNGSLQPKKSRLLSNFYASAAAAAAASAAAAAATGANNNNNPTCHNQDSMHSTSSVDTEPSQCSSLVNSGSAGSPQPSSPSISLHQRLATLNAAAAAAAAVANNTNNNNNSSGNNNIGSNNTNYQLRHHQSQANLSQSAATIRAAVLAAAASQDPSIQSIANRFAADASSPHHQLAATDLSSNQSLATRQALHQTLVRSLLQLKQQQHPQDLLNNLQQQQQQQHNSRALLESLASLSSAGTGSIVDPASNSPTERTGTPPSIPPSPEQRNELLLKHEKSEDSDMNADFLDNNNIALDLAKSSSSFSLKRPRDSFKDDDQDDEEIDNDADDVDDNFPIVDIEEPMPEGEETEVEGDDNDDDDVDDDDELEEARSVGADHLDTAESLLNEEVKRVRKYLKQEPPNSPDEQRLEDKLPQKKRMKLKNNNMMMKNNNNGDNSLDDELHADDITVGAIARALIREICDRRGDQLDVSALREAARYTECFLEILLSDAVLIARHSSAESGAGDDSPDGNNSDGCDKDSEASSLKGSSIRNNSSSSSSTSRREGVVDPSSLSLALKLIPSKLLVAIQQQVSIKSQALSVVNALN